MTKLVKFLFALLAPVALVSLGLYLMLPSGRHTSDREKAAVTVKVVRMDERSGGTGTIVSSSRDSSEILTNAHVCGVVANGGKIITDEGLRYDVVSYKESQLHDLCLITVAADLEAYTAIADISPAIYDEAIVVGHPKLMPTIITKGHFSHKVSIDVNMGFRPCTKEEWESDNALACLFFGGLPIVRQFQSQAISATIQPGSSGSAVYNSNGEIAGLVFAGDGPLSYGYIVPAEYVRLFMNMERYQVASKTPNTILTLAPTSKQTTCANAPDELLAAICKFLHL
jgi:S1-C subfamily serine protease